MRNASLHFRGSHPTLILKRLCLVALVCLLAASGASAQGKQQTISGYAEYYKGGFLIVEGQRIAANQSTVFKKVPSLAGTPLGSEVKVKGVRQSDGTFLASQVEVKANGMAMFEHDALTVTTALENFWVSNGMMLVQAADGEMKNGGRIISDGPGVDRVRAIMARLLPPYIPSDRVRVRLVESEEWNASAMANGAIWVHTSLLRDMSDDELAIILGHELGHFTYEHTRRQMKQQMWINLAAAAAAGATKNPTAQQSIALGLSAWRNGFSREYEDQADRVGLRYAYEGGFDVARGHRVWRRFLERYGEADKLTNIILGSHSRPSERLMNLEGEIALNYGTPLPQVERPTGEVAGIPPAGGPVESAPPPVIIIRSGATTEAAPRPVAPATARPLAPTTAQPVAPPTPRPVGRRPDALPTLSLSPPAAGAAALPLPPHVLRDAAGKLLPASGYQWVNPVDPHDLRVRLMPGLYKAADGRLLPESGYQWVNPADPKDFRVKLMPGLVKTPDGLRPDKGYRWVNPKDPSDLRVEPAP
ncbi:MAG TPA: M48 family metalloprotease [Pyrinomonadaceae bacterium]|jgi:Zn-dependent protease with chaperone function|nr:M48 family metalloprotease [Pyrinomonadaceae bacterium]